MVPEARRAWHAGVSLLGSYSDINSRSIGIEIANPGHEFGYPPFPKTQIGAVTALCKDIIARHKIRADRGLRIPTSRLLVTGPRREVSVGTVTRCRSRPWLRPLPITAGASLKRGVRG